MPYVDVSRDDDFVSIWYVTNSPTGHASSFDPDKPTILLLHPFFLDTSWLDAQFGDPRLSDEYNLIAFDWRAAGKTISRFNGKHDAWTDAVDILLVCYALCLPPVHVWASETISANAAIRFAILFPELCLSLTMLSVPSPTELEVFFHTCDELLHMWAHAGDLDTLEFCLMQCVLYIVGPDVDPDLADELIGYFEMHYPPFKSAKLAQMGNVLMNREPLSPKEYAAVTVPCLLIHGEKNQIHPMECSQNMAADLHNVKDGCKLFIIKGGQGYISIVPQWASISNRVFAKFLSRLPRARSELRVHEEPLNDRLRRALHFLAELANNPSLIENSKEILSSMSFSRASVTVRKSQTETFRASSLRQRGALSPLDTDGRPIRKYSERLHDHWFKGDRFGMSYAESHKSSDDEANDGEHVGAPTIDGRIEAASREVMQESALQRAVFNPGTYERIDQLVVKSNLARVSTTIPLGKILARS
ncbi:alpha/beta-hydrolase [Amylostereum chailletii]|nr:alpha/beta-hydrolase [Amylostereum chailletii]